MKQMHKLYNTIELELDDIDIVEAKYLLGKTKTHLRFLLAHTKYNVYRMRVINNIFKNKRKRRKK